MELNPREFDEELSKQYNLRITRSTLHQAEYKNNFFDTITLNHVLEHVNNPSEMMLELNRILKPGGHLVIATPISDSLTFKIFGKYWAQIDTPRHLFIFSTETLKKYSEEFGFEVISVRHNAIPSIPIVTSIIYFFESRRNRTYSRDLTQNPFLILLLLPVCFFDNEFIQIRR